MSALKNPAVNVRSHAAAQLVAKGEEATGPVLAFLRDHERDANLRSRAVWVLAQLGKEGRAEVSKHLDSEDDPEKVIVAYRALRHGDPKGLLDRANALAGSKFSSVRREVAVSLKGVSFFECRKSLIALIDGYDGRNRYYLEALGVAFHGKEREVYEQLIRPFFPKPGEWQWKAKNLAWRLHTAESVRDLDLCIRAQQPPVDEFRFLAMAFASFRNDQDRLDRSKRLRALAELPAFEASYYQETVREIIAKDLNDLEGEMMTVSYPVPANLGLATKVSEPKEIAKLKGDPIRGKAQAGKCYICHKIEGVGVPFGPELTHWGSQRTAVEILKEIVYPDAKLAHGYEKPVRPVSYTHLTLPTIYSV